LSKARLAAEREHVLESAQQRLPQVPQVFSIVYDALCFVLVPLVFRPRGPSTNPAATPPKVLFSNKNLALSVADKYN
jgi:hypothetical protein